MKITVLWVRVGRNPFFTSKLYMPPAGETHSPSSSQVDIPTRHKTFLFLSSSQIDILPLQYLPFRPSGSDDSKIQTWNSRYFREDSVVVVAPGGSRPRSRRGSGGGEKPMLFPVRSLKSQILEPEESDVAEGRDGFLAFGNGSVSNSSSSSNSPNRMKNASREMSGVGAVDLEEKSMESVVLPSLIPWRSWSGRWNKRRGIGRALRNFFSFF